MSRPKRNYQDRICEYCETQFSKNYKESRKQWWSRRFCSTSCANKALKLWKNLNTPMVKRSVEYRKKLSERIRGKKHPNWKGGISPLVLRIRKCFKYRQWRSDIFTRDNFTCVLCGQRGGMLNADHYPKSFSDIFHENKIKTLEEALNCEEFWDINNGRTLDEKCHNKTKGRKKK